MKKLIKGATLSCMALSATVASAQDLGERMNLPEWTKGMAVNVGFVNDSLDFENSGVDDVDAQGVALELSNNYEIGNRLSTQSALKGKITNNEDEFVEIDNKSIGLTQRLVRSFDVSNVVLKPSVGVGLNYGGLEYGPMDDSDDQQYISYNGEASLKVDTKKGVAPFVTYNYELADLENTSNELTIQSVAAGITAQF